MINNRYNIVIVLLLFVQTMQGQQLKKVLDSGAWFGVKVDYKFAKNYTASFLQDVRLFNAFTTLSKTNTQLGLTYKIDKNFSIGGDVRYIIDRKNGNIYTQDLRYNIDLQVKVKLNKKIRLQYRTRVQQKHENLFPYNLNRKQETIANWRNRIKLTYKLKDNKIYTKAELFREFVVYRQPYFNKLRLMVGDQIDTKIGELDVSLGYERELNIRYPLRFLFVKLYYIINLKRD